MNYVDIDNRMNDIEREAEHLSAYLDEIWLMPSLTQESWVSARACDASIVRLYESLIGILTDLAAVIEDPAIPRGDDWPKPLLLRLANDYPGRRKAVIRQRTFELLESIRRYVDFEMRADIFHFAVTTAVAVATDCLAAVRALAFDLAVVRADEVAKVETGGTRQQNEPVEF
jgi:hypothetical protein